MKSKSATILYVLIFCCMAALNSNALAATLILEATSNGSTTAAAFPNNADLYLNIVAVQEPGDPAGIAGFAFTLTYPAEALTAPALDDQGLPLNSSDITSSHYTYSYSDQSSTATTYRANEAESGKLYLAGVAIDTATGGAVHAVGSVEDVQVVLLTIRFKVKSDAAHGFYNFTLDQTEIMAEAAGHGNDVNDDGLYEPGDGDTKGKISVLVGALAQGEAGWDNFDCSAPPCAFPVLMGDQQDSIHTLQFEVVQDLDSDDDGLLDSEELTIGTDPNDADTDDDGMPDGWEYHHNLNPLIDDASGDPDKDGVSNLDEYLGGTDPEVPNNWDEVAAFVTRFYQQCLGREPETDGLNYWVTSLLDGTRAGADVAIGFIFSQEFINRETTNELYLEILYNAFFNRNADDGGWNYWLTQLNAGVDRKTILDGFIYAKEFDNLCWEYRISPSQVAAFVTRFYEQCLNRYPDRGGLDSWTDLLRRQVNTGTDVSEGFIYSPEFVNRGTSNEDYLAILYKAFFNRNPDPGGWDIWLAELTSRPEKEGRTHVLDGFLGSQEFINLCNEYDIDP